MKATKLTIMTVTMASLRRQHSLAGSKGQDRAHPAVIGKSAKRKKATEVYNVNDDAEGPRVTRVARSRRKMRRATLTLLSSLASLERAWG